MADNDYLFWPIGTLLDAYRNREVSPVEVTEGALARIEALDGRLHSYLNVTPEIAREQARFAEQLYLSNDDAPPLLGVPLSIKDLFDVRGAVTTLGSKLYGSRPAEVDSGPVARLRAAGAVFTGKTNTAEFGQSATTDNLLGPACGNPWDPSRTAGGSSGGAAASVGAGFASAALGSDGGGSIRIPAAMCGLFGLKPTFVELPADEAFKAMSPFVCAGPITRTVDDARRVLSVQLGVDLARGDQRTRRRIAWSPAPEGRAVDPGVRQITGAAAAMLAQMGHDVQEVSLPLDGWTEAFGPPVLDDEWRYRRHLLENPDDLTFYARRAIEGGERVTEAELTAARAMREDVRRRVTSMFEEYDFIVTPTMACLPFPLGQRPTEIDGVKVDSLWGPFPFAAPFNVSGSPAASLPVGLSEGLPVGLQVVAPDDCEAALLDFCEELEVALPSTLDIMKSRWGNVSLSN